VEGTKNLFKDTALFFEKPSGIDSEHEFHEKKMIGKTG
jgi:hypothetical protein